MHTVQRNKPKLAHIDPRPLQPSPCARPLHLCPCARPLQPCPCARPLQPSPCARPLQPSPCGRLCRLGGIVLDLCSLVLVLDLCSPVLVLHFCRLVLVLDLSTLVLVLDVCNIGLPNVNVVGRISFKIKVVCGRQAFREEREKGLSLTFFYGSRQILFSFGWEDGCLLYTSPSPRDFG